MNLRTVGVAVHLAGMASILQSMRIPEPHVSLISLNRPPALTGVLDPLSNSYLSKATRYANNLITGPESLVIVGDYVYTGLSDGWVVEIQPLGPNGRVRKILRIATHACNTSSNLDEEACGRPLGLRASGGYLIAADPYKGIFRINPANGRHELLVDAKSLVNNQPIGFISDLAVAYDGTIFFTSASARWSHAQQLNIFLEGEKSGRLFALRRGQGSTQALIQELVTNLSFPDGIQLSNDETFLLLAERGQARILKVFVGQTPKRGTLELFSANLPGFPANIRRTTRNTFWVGMSSIRHQGAPSLLDRFGHQVYKRRQLMARPASEVKLTQLPHYGLAVELNDRGDIVRSLHDPSGAVFSSISEIQETRDHFFVASPDSNFIGVLKKRDIHQTPVKISSVIQNSKTNRTASMSTIANTNTNVNSVIQRKIHQNTKVLAMVLEKLKAMSVSELSELLVQLVRRFLDAAAQLQRSHANLNKVENDLLQLSLEFRSDLTSHQKYLILKSWTAYNKGPGVLDDSLVIFTRWFNETPEAVRLFHMVPADGATAEILSKNAEFMALVQKFVGALTALVASMDNPVALAHLTRDLGARHSGYGVLSTHVSALRKGILSALENRLKADFTRETRQAWEALLDIFFSYLIGNMSFSAT